MLAGELVAGKERIKARDEKQKLARTMPNTSTAGCNIPTPMPRPMKMGTAERAIPNMREASMSPRRMLETETGHEINLSNVRACVSHGATVGDTALAVKNVVTASIPGSKKSADMSLPMEKAKNKNAGMRTPKITTGPLE